MSRCVMLRNALSFVINDPALYEAMMVLVDLLSPNNMTVLRACSTWAVSHLSMASGRISIMLAVKHVWMSPSHFLHASAASLTTRSTLQVSWSLSESSSSESSSWPLKVSQIVVGTPFVGVDGAIKVLGSGAAPVVE